MGYEVQLGKEQGVCKPRSGAEVREHPRSYKDDVANFSSSTSILLEAGVVGDLVLTCYSLGSRNTKFGYEFGISSDKKKFLQEYKELVEGREALKLVLDLIKKYNLQMPIISEVASLV